MNDLVKELLSRSSDQDGIGWTPTTVVHVPAGLLHRAAARIEQLEAALRAAYEVYAGSDGFVPETCAEGYQRQIITQMVGCISSALDAPA